MAKLAAHRFRTNLVSMLGELLDFALLGDFFVRLLTIPRDPGSPNVRS